MADEFHEQMASACLDERTLRVVGTGDRGALSIRGESAADDLRVA
jgi:hypothetical protein